MTLDNQVIFFYSMVVQQALMLAALLFRLQQYLPLCVTLCDISLQYYFFSLLPVHFARQNMNLTA